jgi:ArsR family transcriptional regulator
MQSPTNTAFRALADQTRRDILRLLRGGPRTSGEIAARFESSWPTISRHLALLREAGLVTTERRGQEIYYELNTSVFQDLVQHLMDWVKPTATDRPTPARKSGTIRTKAGVVSTKEER